MFRMFRSCVRQHGQTWYWYHVWRSRGYLYLFVLYLTEEDSDNFLLMYHNVSWVFLADTLGIHLCLRGSKQGYDIIPSFLTHLNQMQLQSVLSKMR